MDILTGAFALMLGVLFGAFLVWLVTVRPLRTQVSQTAELLRQKAVEAAQLEATLNGERQQHRARVDELEKMGQEIERKFVALSSAALEQSNNAFLTLANQQFDRHKQSADADLEQRKAAIENLVSPLATSIEKFERQVAGIESAREGAYRAMLEQVKNVTDGQLALKSETARLVQALRTPKTRGRWGEFQLRNVLDICGMTEKVDFIEQPTIESDDGRLRPDLIVRIPGGKFIVVDAKTPLDAYLSAIETSDEAERAAFLISHARQVRDHIKSLASREYWKSIPDTADFVVMFVPGEAFFAAAIDQDPSLFEQALRERVFVSTPTTFVPLLKAVAYSWQQAKLAENAEAVARLARELFDRIKGFGVHMGGLGRALKLAVERYNRSVGSLETRVLVTARRFELLGVVSPDDTLPRLDPVDVETREVQAAELLTPTMVATHPLSDDQKAEVPAI